ncbi:MAG: hypothetical protein ACKVJK_04085, partial [Methylophagaceae bacterium]
MAVTDPIYKINGIEASKAKIAEVAKGHNMTADEYITNFKGVLVPGKTLDSTINANPDVESGNTELASEDISLEQFDVMEVAEKKKLSYKDSQRLIRERDRRDKGGIDSFDVSSEDYSKIKDDEKIKLQEEASKQLLKEYEGVPDFKITAEQIDEKAVKLLKEK